MWKISNILSLSRIIMVIPVCWMLLIDKEEIAIGIGVIAMLTDAFDGYFARKYDQITELGKILDPLADKVMLAGVSIALIIKGLLPLWFVLLVIFRDILILIGGRILSKRLMHIPPSNMIGKITFTILGITVLGILFKIPYFDPYGLYFSTFMVILSLFSYLRRLITILRANRKSG